MRSAPVFLAVLGLFVGATLVSPRNALAQPANDDFASARLIQGTSGSVSGTTKGASHESGEPAHAGSSGVTSVWYRWVAPSNRRVTLVLETDDSDQAPVLAVYTGSSVAALTEVVSAAVRARWWLRVAFDAVAGTDYRIAIDNSGVAGPFYLSLRPTPANDDFGNAQRIEGVSGKASGSGFGSTFEPGEPAHGGFASFGSVWYRWIAPSNARVTFTLGCAWGGAVIAVYTGSTVAALTEVGSGDDDVNLPNSSVPARVGFLAVAGTEYRIAAAGGCFEGWIRLRWLAGPRNDDFDARLVLHGRRGEVTGSNQGGTHETGEPRHAARRAYPWGTFTADGRVSVWYRWTAQATGHILFETLGSKFDTALAVYRGNRLDALTRVARSNDILAYSGPSAISFRAIAGRTYSVAISGIAGEYEGEAWISKGLFTLRWHPGRVLTGTRDADVIRGTQRDDLIVGGRGDDRLYGARGSDLIVGQQGADRLYGGRGADVLDTRDFVRGNDLIYGGPGLDSARADRGDSIHGVEK
jgi:Ca2+-binding RTX toxin-like protein